MVVPAGQEAQLLQCQSLPLPPQHWGRLVWYRPEGHPRTPSQFAQPLLEKEQPLGPHISQQHDPSRRAALRPGPASNPSSTPSSPPAPPPAAEAASAAALQQLGACDALLLLDGRGNAAFRATWLRTVGAWLQARGAAAAAVRGQEGGGGEEAAGGDAAGWLPEQHLWAASKDFLLATMLFA